MEENIRTLGVEDKTTVSVTSAFLWAKRDLPAVAESIKLPWLVFCSPPYAFYLERQAEMLELISRIREYAPPDSLLIVEAEEPFDFDLIRGAHVATQAEGTWDVRMYAPAVVGIWQAE